MIDMTTEVYTFAEKGPQGHHAVLLPGLEAFLPKAPQRIIDIGCGYGQVTNWLHEKGHSVTGCDFAPGAIEIAKKSYPNVDFFVTDAERELPPNTPEGGFDGLVSVEVIEHLYDPMTAIQKMRNMIKPGGWAIITTPYHGYFKNLAISLVDGWDEHWMVDFPGGHIKFFSLKTLKTMLLDCGFIEPEYKLLGRVPLLRMQMVFKVRVPA